MWPDHERILSGRFTLKPKDLVFNEKINDHRPKDCRECCYYLVYGSWCDYHNREIRREWEESCEHFKRRVVKREKGYKTLEEIRKNNGMSELVKSRLH